MIPDDVVDRVRNETDIVSLIGEFVKLKRVGNSYRGPCPFHHGKNPNFSVTDRGYNCFKCGESGDVFTFIQKHLGLTFVEAVKWVGAKSGVEVPEVARRSEETDAREPLWEVNATAAEFFRTQLWESPEGKTGRDYLASRGIGQHAADRFGIGYAPYDGAEMRAALRTLGFDDDRQLAAGVLRKDQDKPEARARFRKRLMFPIYDLSGHVVGFGGRVLGVGEPKYLNSAESLVFSKSTLLYGMNWAKQAVRKAERLVIVEGYFDVIRLHLAGVTEAVAPLGTALTEDQSALIRKYTKNVFLLYDGDKAGLAATFKSGDRLLAHGIAPRVISLPDGDDPDTFVAKEGADGFERVANDAVDVFDRKIQMLQRAGYFNELHKKLAAIDKLTPTIRASSDDVVRDLYVARTMEVAGITREVLLRHLEAAPRERRVPREAAGPPPELGEWAEPGEPAVRVRERRANHRAIGVRAERELVRVVLHQRRYVATAAARVNAEQFIDPAYAAIFAELTAHEQDASISEIAASLDEDSTEVLQELMNENGGLDRAEESIEGSINQLRSRELSEQLNEIDRLLPLADSDKKDDLIREKTRLAAEMQALGRPRWKSFNSVRH